MEQQNEKQNKGWEILIAFMRYVRALPVHDAEKQGVLEPYNVILAQLQDLAPHELKHAFRGTLRKCGQQRTVGGSLAGSCGRPRGHDGECHSAPVEGDRTHD